MPEKETLERAAEDKAEGKSASTQAGEFVREEIEHIREGKHGARSAKQAIAIGLSKARRAGVKLAAPKKGKASAEEIMDFVGERLAPHKKIRYVEFIPQIPKSASGKILRRVLVEKERAKAKAQSDKL